MREFALQATLIATIRVKAETRAEAEQKLGLALEASGANLGMLDDEPIVVPVEIEGDLDLIESAEAPARNPSPGRGNEFPGSRHVSITAPKLMRLAV